ncbi:MAG: hypothetical protein HQM03_08420 [Magnetococcales bacterium]|nr:hypothetical protein [Magnetococcales bacterium]
MSHAIAKVVDRGDCQEIHLPRKFHLEASEVIVSLSGNSLILTPCRASWQGFVEGFQYVVNDLVRPDEEASVDIPRKAFA